jgi:hypothetical protein
MHEKDLPPRRPLSCGARRQGKPRRRAGQLSRRAEESAVDMLVFLYALRRKAEIAAA